MSRPAIAWINLDHLRHNYRLLAQLAAPARVMAVVKANAYGHGLNLVAPALFEAGCRGFAVSEAKEGALLRDILANIDHTISAEITLLSGIFDVEGAALASAHRLTPVVIDSNQLILLQQSGFNGSVWIKVDTGMNRLGASDADALLQQCLQADIRVRGMMSHLACADIPEHPLNRQQTERFKRLRSAVAPDLPASLLNSAGMVSMPDQRLEVVRPGIALYGSEPVTGHPLGLKPVMCLTARVLQIRQIEAGDTISYGAGFTASRRMRIAVVSAGYADGIPRALSNCGHAIYLGAALPITGRVCMDYTMLDVTGSDIKCGDNVEFWGHQLTANTVAAMIDTISYTLFTGVGERVQRVVV
ncbi:MAG: alanine racemase [Mariprofundus sp.]